LKLSESGFALLLLHSVPLAGEVWMMETQLTSGEFVEQRVSVEDGAAGDLPHPFGASFKLG
jgi:hypothetical protein